MAVPLHEPRERLIDAVHAAMQQPERELEQLLGVKGDALERARLANTTLRESPTRPAAARYDGVLYRALAIADLPEGERRALRGRLLIVSGLWGLVGLSDPLPDYRLKMGARLPGIGSVAAFWRPHLAAALLPGAAAGIPPGATVWDLLPQEHAAACRWPANQRRISAVFLDATASGELRPVSHWNKLLKGALVRHANAVAAGSAADLRDFRHPEGYERAPELDTADGRTATVAFVRRTGDAGPAATE